MGKCSKVIKRPAAGLMSKDGATLIDDHPLIALVAKENDEVFLVETC